ncbi:hypothetical protein FG386_002349 [Cryptosporidium ryanae]|uniref:uncharacterized protein n=1 Tax=Cryptosporidium ryanae TaxID=515981 RepID=UPI00351AA5C7|nr:hypothetical protein FG386_002349 [Cryptosporidium ryanae]
MYAILELPLSVLIFISFLLSVGSAVFSGLTLGMMTQDLLYLKVASVSSDKEKKWSGYYAKKLLPLRLDGNLLLVTLLFGNVTVNTGLSILISELTSGWLGFTVSTILILILGEIIPQAICSRYGLYIGGFFSPFIRLIQVTLYPILRPISFVLDKVVGKNSEKLYNKEELLTLLEYHSMKGVITANELKLINRILFSQCNLSNIVSSINEFPTVNVNSNVDYSTLNWYVNNGITRVYVLDNEHRLDNNCAKCDNINCSDCFCDSNHHSHAIQTQNRVSNFYTNNLTHYPNQNCFPVRHDVIVLEMSSNKMNSETEDSNFSGEILIHSPNTDDTCDSEGHMCSSDRKQKFNGSTIIGYINLSELISREKNDVSFQISNIVNTKCFRRLTSIVISADTMGLLIENGNLPIIENISNIKDKLLCIESRTRVQTLLSVLCQYNLDQKDVIFVYSHQNEGSKISYDGVITQREVFNHLFL